MATNEFKQLLPDSLFRNSQTTAHGGNLMFILNTNTVLFIHTHICLFYIMHQHMHVSKYQVCEICDALL